MRKMKDSGIEWIGMIPENVNILRNKYLISYVKGKLPANINTEKEGIPYIGASDLEDLSGNCTYTSYTTDTTLPSCSEEDVLILWDGARAGLIGTNHKGAVASTVVNAIPKHTINKKFWYWYLKAFQAHLYNRVNGTTIPHMNTDYIEEIAMLDWTIEDQEKIAAYLDKKCAEIDAIIAAKEKTNELLKERRQSIIYEAVTKGLDPTVSMKDSGIEWIGEIPESWDCKKIKYAFNLLAGATPKSGNEEYWDGDIVWITPADYTTEDMYIYAGHKTITDEGLNSCATTIIPEESIIFSKRAPIGLVAINKVPLCTNQGCISCIPNKDVDSKFYYYVMSAFTKEFDLFGSGTTFKEISAEAFANFILPNTSIDEQKEIAEYLDSKCTEINDLISANDSTISKLKEYRQSVIYEAVTGKVEI